MKMNKDMMNKVLGGVVIVALVGGGVWLAKKSKKQEEVMPEITLESSMQMDSDADLKSAMSEEEKQQIEEAFKKEGSEITGLTDVTGGGSSGTAFRVFDGDKFFHKVETRGMLALEKGFFYEGWLVGNKGFFSTGRMMVMNGEGSLYYMADEDKGEFSGVVITLEPEDGDPAPAGHVLEGGF